jgi:hypothetical protein
MNAELVPVGVQDNRRPAVRKVERLKGKLHVVMSEMFYRLVEVVHFQHKLRTVPRWLQEWFFSDSQRVRADLILDPESVNHIHGSRAGKPENALIKDTGPRQIRGWIYNKSKFNNLHWWCQIGLTLK